ncbi:MAG: hypothetical protein EP298_04235 [Gammaproteobacteria bacterium]|nr:MAG: hypothetical protein EP298_04235 [Gammaproteobacteria bacterium]UTW43839.1 hypothetical protein KFE69_07045 [bacterium SCSIO 12844]
MSINKITFRSHEGDRDIIVVNGYAFYRSTGSNSRMPGVWFPFYGINTNSIKYGWLIKPENPKLFLGNELMSDPYFSKIWSNDVISRFGNLETAYISYCLGGDIWNLAKQSYYNLINPIHDRYGFHTTFIRFFDDHKINLKQTYEVNDKSDLVTKSIHDVNEWLKSQNTIYFNDDISKRVNFPSAVSLKTSNSSLIYQLTDEEYAKSKLLRIIDKVLNENNQSTEKFKAITVLRNHIESNHDMSLEDLQIDLLQFERLVSHKRIGFRSVGSEANSYSNVKNDIRSLRKTMGLDDDQNNIDQFIKQKQIAHGGVFTFSDYIQGHQHEISNLES